MSEMVIDKDYHLKGIFLLKFECLLYDIDSPILFSYCNQFLNTNGFLYNICEINNTKDTLIIQLFPEEPIDG